MIPFAILGVLLMSGIIGFGIYKLINNFTVKSTTDRYRYVKTKDENGDEIIKVVDLEVDNEKT